MLWYSLSKRSLVFCEKYLEVELDLLNSVRERERERERERKRERERRERQKDRERKTERQRETKRDRDTERHRETHRETQRETERESSCKWVKSAYVETLRMTQEDIVWWYHIWITSFTFVSLKLRPVLNLMLLRLLLCMCRMLFCQHYLEILLHVFWMISSSSLTCFKFRYLLHIFC